LKQKKENMDEKDAGIGKNVVTLHPKTEKRR
jgi:hypothetical protein